MDYDDELVSFTFNNQDIERPLDRPQHQQWAIWNDTLYFQGRCFGPIARIESEGGLFMRNETRFWIERGLLLACTGEDDYIED